MGTNLRVSSASPDRNTNLIKGGLVRVGDDYLVALKTEMEALSGLTRAIVSYMILVKELEYGAAPRVEERNKEVRRSPDI